MRLGERRAQSVMEYAALTAIIAAALIGMSIYMKRGMAGRLRGAADSIGEQYDPKATTFNYTTTFNTNTKVQSTLRKVPGQDLGGGVVKDITVMDTTTTVVQDLTNRTGSENVGAIP